MSILKVSIDFINQTHGSFSAVSFIIQECFNRIDDKNFIEKINHSEMPLYLFWVALACPNTDIFWTSTVKRLKNTYAVNKNQYTFPIPMH